LLVEETKSSKNKSRDLSRAKGEIKVQKYNFDNMKDMKVKKEFSCRDGIVKRNTKVFLEEVNEFEQNGEGIKTPYKILFDKCSNKPFRGGFGSDWFSDAELEMYFEKIVEENPDL